MQYLFKTRYNDDIKFLAKTGEKVRVAIVAVCLLAAPLFLQDYYLAELGLMLVYAIAGIGLMILTGHTGQVSFGHAAFLGIGAYTHSVLMSHGVPFLISIPLTILLTGLIGMLIGRSASKMHGFYLAIATLAFGILIETVFGEWGSVTGGHSGMVVPDLNVFGVSLREAWQQYYLDLVFAALVIWGASNLFRAPTGRSFVAVRDSELSARCLGVNVEWVKIQSFGVSAAITGLAGALLAHHLTYLGAGRIRCAGVSEADADDRRRRLGQYPGRGSRCRDYFDSAGGDQLPERCPAAECWANGRFRADVVWPDYCAGHRL